MVDFQDPNYIEYLAEQMDHMTRDLASRSRAIKDVDFIAERAVRHWQKDGLDFYLCENSAWKEMQQPAIQKLLDDGTLHRDILDFGQWNGYIKFPKLPALIPGYGGIYTYVPVHGGITFFQEWADGSCTYGFDCSHAHSNESPITDINWVMAEAESMARSIRIAARFEPYYLKAGDDNEKKSRVLMRMHKFLPVEIRGNFGIMINLLGGEL